VVQLLDVVGAPRPLRKSGPEEGCSADFLTVGVGSALISRRSRRLSGPLDGARRPWRYPGGLGSFSNLVPAVHAAPGINRSPRGRGGPLGGPVVGFIGRAGGTRRRLGFGWSVGHVLPIVADLPPVQCAPPRRLPPVGIVVSSWRRVLRPTSRPDGESLTSRLGAFVGGMGKRGKNRGKIRLMEGLFALIPTRDSGCPARPFELAAR